MKIACVDVDDTASISMLEDWEIVLRSFKKMVRLSRSSFDLLLSC